jgi:hypothetical protein
MIDGGGRGMGEGEGASIEVGRKRGEGGDFSSVADPDPGFGAFLIPGSGIRDEQPESYFRELRKNFLG